jgi:hypothetical protein
MLTTRLAEAVRIHFTASRDAFYGLPLWKLLPTSAYKQLIESEDAIYKYAIRFSIILYHVVNILLALILRASIITLFIH